MPNARSILNTHYRHGNTILAFHTKPIDLNICSDQTKHKASIATYNAAALLSIAKTFVMQCMLNIHTCIVTALSLFFTKY